MKTETEIYGMANRNIFFLAEVETKMKQRFPTEQMQN
jgi:hypothetical protein